MVGPLRAKLSPNTAAPLESAGAGGICRRLRRLCLRRADCRKIRRPVSVSELLWASLGSSLAFSAHGSVRSDYWDYANLNYAGIPLGQSFYDSMVVDVVKRTGRGLTIDMSYTWSRQEN